MFNSFLRNGMGMSLVRHALTWGSGVLVAKGTISPDLATQVVSLAIGAAGLFLSGQDKKVKQAEFDSLRGLASESETRDRDAWIDVQKELDRLRQEVETRRLSEADLRKEKEHYREIVESPTAISLEERASEVRPQARYKHISVANNSGFLISEASRQKLKGVNPLLCEVVETAMSLCAVDFKVTEGVRTLERQAELLADGRSWVKTSKHQVDPENGLGHAVDVMALPTPAGSWDWEYYEQINDAMQAAAKTHGARITWGGHWAVMDGGHFQLDGEAKE